MHYLETQIMILLQLHEDTDTEKRTMHEKISQEIKSCPESLGEKRFYISLPQISDHKHIINASQVCPIFKLSILYTNIQS